MEAIEFKTKIKNGTIQIPDKYKKKIGNTVQVILISDQPAIIGEQEKDIIDKLLSNPIKLKNFSPFSREEVYERL